MPDDDVPVNQNPGEYIVPASTPVLRADALDDEEHRPDEPQSPVEEPDVAELPPGFPRVEDGYDHVPGGESELVCPVCGLVTCFHNLARVPKE